MNPYNCPGGQKSSPTAMHSFPRLLIRVLVGAFLLGAVAACDSSSGGASTSSGISCDSLVELATEAGYILSEGTGCAINDPITSAEVTLIDDDVSSLYSMPWSFPFFDRNYSNISVDSNGNLWMTNTACDDYEIGLPDGGTSCYKPVISVWNDDLDAYYCGDVYDTCDGVQVQSKTDPDRIVVRWHTETHTDSSADYINLVSAQLTPSGEILFHYHYFDTSTDCNDYGSGISKADSTNYIDLSATVASVCTLEGRSFVFQPET